LLSVCDRAIPNYEWILWTIFRRLVALTTYEYREVYRLP
jgi:hypothetical protein